MIFSSVPGVIMLWSGASLEAQHHLHLGAERLAVELDRLFAASIEHKIRLDRHRTLLPRGTPLSRPRPLAQRA